MKTVWIDSWEQLDQAARLLKNGELVAVPTETVYGLAGNGLDEDAVRAIYETKGRPERKPLSLMVPDVSAMELCCTDVPEQAKFLAERFWPGPLTIILKAQPVVPPTVRASGDTVGLRCPDHPMTLELLRKAGIPFAAPSANPSGAPSPKTAAEVGAYFNGKIAAVIDGGACGLGFESTLIDMTRTPFQILRQGALPSEAIADALVEHMKVIGFTGPSGSGKTTALHEVELLGGLVLDCDRIYHELLKSDGQLPAAIAECFPGTVKQGKLDRKALGSLVFAEPEALKRLNEVTHRFVANEVTHRLRSWAMSGGTLAAIDAVELLSSGIGEDCDATVAVLAPKEKRIQRIMMRDGLSVEEAVRRVEAQRPDDYYLSNCAFILENESSESDFREKIQKLIKEILDT